MNKGDEASGVEVTNSVAPFDNGAIDPVIALMQLALLNLPGSGVSQVAGIISHELMKHVPPGLECHLRNQLVRE